MKKFRLFLLINMLGLLILTACNKKEKITSTTGHYIDAFDYYFDAKPDQQIYEHTPASLFQGTSFTDYYVVLSDELAENPIFDVGEGGVSRTVLLGGLEMSEMTNDVAREAVFNRVINWPLEIIARAIYTVDDLQRTFVKAPYTILSEEGKNTQTSHITRGFNLSLSSSKFDQRAYKYIQDIHRLAEASDAYYIPDYKVAEEKLETVKGLYDKLNAENYLEKLTYKNREANKLTLVLDTNFFEPEYTFNQRIDATDDPSLIEKYIHLEALPSNFVLHVYDRHGNLITYNVPKEDFFSSTAYLIKNNPQTT